MLIKYFARNKKESLLAPNDSPEKLGAKLAFARRGGNVESERERKDEKEKIAGGEREKKTRWVRHDRGKRLSGMAARYGPARIAICMEIRAGREFRRRHRVHFLYRIALPSLVIMRRRASLSLCLRFAHRTLEYNGDDECLPVPSYLHSWCKWPFSRGAMSIPNVFTLDTPRETRCQLCTDRLVCLSCSCCRWCCSWKTRK